MSEPSNSSAYSNTSGKTQAKSKTYTKSYTKCKKVKDAYQISEEKLQNIINSVDDGISLVGLDGKVLDCNEASLRLLGLTREEFINSNVYDVIVPEDRQRAVEGSYKVLEKGRFLNQVRVLKKNSDPFFAEISVTALYDKNRKIIGFIGITRDITERKKAEEALKESEQLYRTVFDNSQDAFQLVELIYDKNGKPVDQLVLKVNQAYETQTGLKAADVTGKTMKEYAPNIESYWFEQSDKVLKTGKSMHIENYNQDTNRYYDAYAFPYSKKVVGILFRDITAHKKAEEILNKKQQELDCILDSSPTIIFYKDREGKFIQANKTFSEALKIPKQQLLGKTVFDLYSTKIAQSMTNDDIVVMKSKHPKLGIIEPYESPTGLRWIRTDKIPSFDENGNVTGLIGFSEDITERKKAEEALTHSCERINEILESISDDFMVLDYNWNFVYANSQAAKLVGLEPKDIVGKNFWQMFPQNRGTPIEQNLQQAMQKREIMRFELLGQYSHRYKLITTYPSVDGIALIATDITERKHLEQQLQEKDRMAAIGQTAGMVGHDLRNPLQSLIGEIYLAKKELAALPESAQKSNLQESMQAITDQIAYMDKIVSDLQTFVKPVEPIMQVVKLKPLIVSLLEQTNNQDNIQTSTQIPDALTVEADPQLLKRVLINLVTNATQAMPQGGKLTIKAESNKQGQVQIIVEDTGTGIPEEIKPKIFTPLFTTKSKGQGFGLAVCKRVIEAQGGIITFESQVGRGTKFMIKFPVK